MLIAILSSLIFGIMPAKKMSSGDPTRSLKSGASVGTERGDYRLRSAFVVTEVALSLMLLVCTGLVLMQLWRMQHVDFGYTTDHLLTLEINVSPGEYAGKDLDAALYRPLEEKVRAIPGVTGAGYNRLVPLLNWGWNSGINMVGKPPDPPDHERLAEVRMVSPGWYQAMGLRLLRGRLPDPAIDKPGSHQVVGGESEVRRHLSPRRRADGPADQAGPRQPDHHRRSEQWPSGDRASRQWRRWTIPCRRCRSRTASTTLSTMSLFVRTTVPPETIVRPAAPGVA